MIPTLNSNLIYAQYLSIPSLPVAKSVNTRYVDSAKQPEKEYTYGQITENRGSIRASHRSG